MRVQKLNHSLTELLSRSCSHRFNAFHAETKRPLHRECGFIRMQPGTNRVAFIIAQNSGSDVTDWSKPLLLCFCSVVDCDEVAIATAWESQQHIITRRREPGGETKTLHKSASQVTDLC